MTTFVAVYRGASVADARLLAVSSDPSLVARLVEELMGDHDPDEYSDASEERSPLRIIRSDDEP